MEPIYTDIINWINQDIIPGLVQMGQTGGSAKIEDTEDKFSLNIFGDDIQDIVNSLTSDSQSNMIIDFLDQDKKIKKGGANKKILMYSKSIASLQTSVFVYLIWKNFDIQKYFSFTLVTNIICEKYGPLNIYVAITMISFVLRIIAQGINAYISKPSLLVNDFIEVFTSTPIYLLEFFGLSLVAKSILYVIKNISGGSNTDTNLAGGFAAIQGVAQEFIKIFVNIKNSLVQLVSNLANSSNPLETIINFGRSIIDQMLGKQIIPEFYFEFSTGYIVCNKIGRSINKQICSNPEIQIKVNSFRQIDYLVGSQKLDSISMIQGKPIHTALVVAWSGCGPDSKKSTVLSPGIKYRYQINSDSSVSVFDAKTNTPIYSIHSPQVLTNESTLAQAKTQLCTDIFGQGYQDSKCSKLFYNLLGRAGLSSIFESPDIKNNLLSSNPQTQLDILKALKWKLDIHRKLVTVTQWLSTQPTEYTQYLKANPQVSQILDSLITNINTNHYQLLSSKI